MVLTGGNPVKRTPYFLPIRWRWETYIISLFVYFPLAIFHVATGHGHRNSGWTDMKKSFIGLKRKKTRLFLPMTYRFSQVFRSIFPTSNPLGNNHPTGRNFPRPTQVELLTNVARILAKLTLHDKAAEALARSDAARSSGSGSERFRQRWNASGISSGVKVAGWWFGTCFIFPYIGLLIIPIDFHIFQRGGPTTNQVGLLKTSICWAGCRGVPRRSKSFGCLELTWFDEGPLGTVMWQARPPFFNELFARSWGL